MSNFANSKSVILKGVTLDYFDAFTPGKPARPGGKAKYKAKVIFEPNSEAYNTAKSALIEAAKALWGDNYATVVPAIPANNKALRNGNGNLDPQGAIKPEYKDKFFLSCSNETKPQVVGPTRVGGKFVNIRQDGTCDIDGTVTSPPYKIVVPYRGCKVNLKVTFVAGKTMKIGDEQIPNQIYAKFEALQFAGDGKPFGSGPTSAEGFEDEDTPEGAAAEVGAGGDDLF